MKNQIYRTPTERAAEQRAEAHRAELEAIREAQQKARAHGMNPLNITATATAAELYTAAEIAVSIAVRAMHNKSGLQLYREIQLEYYPDQIARAAAENANREQITKALKAQAEKNRTAYRQIATATGTDPEDRAAAADLWREEADTAARYSEALKDETALYSMTLSQSRSDLTQAAVMALIETWTTPAEITPGQLAAAGLESIEEADPETREALQTAANFRAAINAARRESSNLAHPDSQTRISTKKTEATAEDVRAWVDTMGGTGKDYRRGASRKNTKATDCWETMEQSRPNDPTPGKWYRVKHYKTVAPYTSYEAAEEAAGHPIIDPEQGDYTDKEAAAAALAEIVAAANLTERERHAIRIYCQKDGKARTAAALARAEYMQSRTAAIMSKPTEEQRNRAHREAVATADNKATRARWTAALQAAGYTNERTRRRAQAAIIAALQGAAEKPHEPNPTRDNPTSRPDLIAAISRPQTPRTDTMHPVTYCDPDTGRVLTAYTETAEAAARAIHEAHQSQSKTPTGKPDHSNPTKAKTPEEAARAAKAYRERKPNPETVFIVECADPKTAKATGRICTHA